MTSALKYSNASPLRNLVVPPKDPDDWTAQLCWTLDLAQDQKSIKIIEGGKVRTYSALIKGTDKDAQSEAGGRIRKVSVAAIRDALHLALSSKFADAWAILEDPGTEHSLDPERQSWEPACNNQAGIIEEDSEEWTSDRLADELLSLDIENDWPCLRELILAAEDLDFTVEQSAQLAPRLLDLAVQYRGSNDAQDAPAVYSAIRTGASMLRPSEASLLLLLLEPGHPIDTCLVALKMVGRIFEAQPPSGLDQHMDLAREVREIADAFLNRRVIGISQSAAMAQLAVYALAAMASSETLDIARAVQQIDISWFKRQIAGELCELQSSWSTRSIPAAPEVLELLDRVTHEL